MTYSNLPANYIASTVGALHGVGVAPAQLRAMVYENRFEAFIRAAWHVIEPGTPYVHGWHVSAICDHLQAVSRGQIRKLIINVPPRHMKSLQCAVLWPAWEWTFNPASRFLFASYAHTLSIRDSVKTRRLIESDWYQEHWKEKYSLTSDQNSKIRFDNSAAGYRLATSVGGSLTGEGGDRIVIDDAHNVVDGESDAIRSSTIQWWDQAMSTRLNNPKTGAYVIVMQRIKEDDLVGHILAREHGWDHLCLPAEYEPDHPFPIKSSIGFRDPRTTKGELLWPERMGRTELNEIKVKLGTYGTAGQLQQRPSPAGGGMFLKAWVRNYTHEGSHFALHTPTGIRRVLKGGVRFITSDLALSEKESADYTVMQCWQQTQDNDLILVDQERGQWQAPEVEAKLKSFRIRSGAAFIGVETKHYGLAVFQSLIKNGVPVVELRADKDKVARAVMASVMMENGRVYLPQEADWLGDFINELLLFPNAKHDDQVDTLAYACRYVDERPLYSGGNAVSCEDASGE